MAANGDDLFANRSDSYLAAVSVGTGVVPLNEEVANNYAAPPSSQKAAAAATPKAAAVEEEEDVKGGCFKKSNKQSQKAAEAEARRQELMSEMVMDEHKLSLADLAARYGTNIERGHDTATAERLLRENGENELTPIRGTPWWVTFSGHMFGGFARLLWIGAILCFIAYGIDSTRGTPAPDNLVLGVVLALVVTITALFSFYQEAKSSAIMDKFGKMVPQKCKVWRDGELKSDFLASKLVLGDIIEVKYGDRIPADICIVGSSGLKVDNSSLTGENEHQKRDIYKPGEEAPERCMEAQNIAWFTSEATEGSARGMVIRCGDDTFMGRIYLLVQNTDTEETPIAKEIHHFIFLITSVAIFLGVTFFALAFALGYYWLDAVLFLIAIIVANVPEGLLATVTVSLTLTALRMAKKSVLVKNLESVETLGSTSTICSDKTGTLTQNKMTVAHMWYDGKVRGLEVVAARDGDAVANKDDASYKALYTIGALCNTAIYVYETEEDKSAPIKERSVEGDASESAILKCVDSQAELYGGYFIDSAAYRAKNPKVLNIPFSSKVKFAASVHQTHDGREGDKLLMVLKGAPERVANRCTSIYSDGKVVPMTPELKKQFEIGVESLARRGERVLGFAHKFLDPAKYPKDFQFQQEKPYNNVLEDNDLTFVGLMALLDPPRPEVPPAVLSCQNAGIQVIMVTGDFPLTAKAIAHDVNILSLPDAEDLAFERGLLVEGEGKNLGDLPQDVQDELTNEAQAIVVTGEQLELMDEKDIDRVLRKKQVVFARTSPQQKLVIVRGVQRRGDVVAVTGDGVNDSPALTAADIGVAMGITGSDVSKEAADMILLDDNFASIEKGVEEGRLIFDNLKKSIAYTLTSNIPEITPFLIFLVVQIPLPLSTIMILAIDLGTDMYPAISLAYERPESDIMLRRPRDSKKDKLVASKLLSMTYLQIGFIQALAGFFCYFVVLGDGGFNPGLLVGLRAQFDNTDNESVQDSYGNMWGYRDRQRLLSSAQTSYFVSIVVVQWADLIICKTRMLSIFQQKMINWTLNKALFFETALAAFITYCPGMDVALKTVPLSANHFIWPAIPNCILIWCYDETRRYLMRRHRYIHGVGGWVEQETYW